MVIVNVDFFSCAKVSGWTNALIDDNTVIIKTDNGLSSDITKYITIIRKDVNDIHELEEETPTGFHINLFDLFNCRVNDFDIYIGGFRAWSSRAEIKRLEHEPASYMDSKVTLGGRRLFIIYEKHSWLDIISGKLDKWNPNQFNKVMNNSVSISFINIDDFRGLFKNSNLHKSSNVFIIERSVVRDAIVVDNSISLDPLLILDRKIDLSLDYQGALSSVCSINDIKEQKLITANMIRGIIDTLTSYGEIFFSSGAHFLLHVHGEPTEKTTSKIRSYNDEKVTFEGGVIFSEEKLRKKSDFDKSKDSLFINSKLLKFTFDILDEDPETFLNTCLVRGINIRSEVVGEGV